VVKEVFDSVFQTVYGGRGLGFPPTPRSAGSLGLQDRECLVLNVRGIIVNELLSKVMGNTMDATLETLVARSLPWLHETFDLVFFTFGT
jgi:hypothetical protein